MASTEQRSGCVKVQVGRKTMLQDAVKKDVCVGQHEQVLLT